MGASFTDWDLARARRNEDRDEQQQGNGQESTEHISSEFLDSFTIPQSGLLV